MFCISARTWLQSLLWTAASVPSGMSDIWNVLQVNPCRCRLIRRRGSLTETRLSCRWGSHRDEAILQARLSRRWGFLADDVISLEYGCFLVKQTFRYDQRCNEMGWNFWIPKRSLAYRELLLPFHYSILLSYLWLSFFSWKLLTNYILGIMYAQVCHRWSKDS